MTSEIKIEDQKFLYNIIFHRKQYLFPQPHARQFQKAHAQTPSGFSVLHSTKECTAPYLAAITEKVFHGKV